MVMAEEGKGRRLFPIGQEGEAPPEFGTAAPVIRVKRFFLDNARNLEWNEMGGTLLWAYQASSLVAAMDITINDQKDNAVTFGLGQFIRGVPYSRIFVTNAAQGGEWIDIVYAKEKDITKIEIVNSLVQAGTVIVTRSTVLNTVGDVPVAAATVQVLAANAARRAAFISNLGVNPNVVRVGDAATAAARGAEIAIGATAVVSSTEAIYVYSAGASNIGVTWTED